jgi:hypothetical protein
MGGDPQVKPAPPSLPSTWFARGIAAVTVAAALAALAALAPGCAREPSPLQPVVATAIVEGRVGAAAPGHNLIVAFVSLDGQYRRFATRVDDAGRYRAEVPAGDYTHRLEGALPRSTYLTPAGEPTMREADAETLRLRAGVGVVRRDFRLGGLRLLAAGLEALDGWRCGLSLHRLEPGDTDTTSIGTSSADVSGGALDLRTLPALPGAYMLKTRFEGGPGSSASTAWRWYAATGASSSPDTLRIGPDSVTTVTASWPAPAVLSGRITGAWQELGMSAPNLYAVDEGGAFVSGGERVGIDGTFRLILPHAEPVRLRATWGGVGTAWVGGLDEASATVFSPPAGGTIAGIEHAVSGLLVRPRSEVPLTASAICRIELHEVEGLAPVQTIYVQSDRSSGAHCLRPGTYRIRLVNDPQRSLWRPQWYDRAATMELAAPVVIPVGGTLVIDPVLERGGQISGTALTGGADDGFVIITSADEAIVLDVAWVTAAEPGFGWTGLADGRYRVGLYCGDYWYWPGSEVPPGTLWYPGVTEWAAGADLEIVDAGVITGLVVGAAPGR